MNCSENLYKNSFQSNSDGLVYKFQTVMAKAEAEAWDMKKLEKMFKRQLTEIEIDKEMLEIKLQKKVQELNELQMQYRVKEVFNSQFGPFLTDIYSKLYFYIRNSMINWNKKRDHWNGIWRWKS